VTEEQVYTVVGDFDGAQLRSYDNCVLAEVEVDGSFESVGNKAFNPLFGFISGRNQSDKKIAMTAPVLQDVPQGKPRRQKYSVSFVMPANATRADLPDPTDERVSIREVPAHDALALRFSGRWSGSSFEKQLRALESTAKRHGFTLIGDPRFARFNPPWTPWFLRRNEVIWTVANERRKD
jgi:hypothetical protein